MNRYLKVVKNITAMALASLSLAAHAVDMHGVVRNTMSPLTMFGRAIYGICYIAGTGFILSGLIQYKYHRDNPQQVRISTPITLVAVGALLWLLPYLTSYSSSGHFLK